MHEAEAQCTVEGKEEAQAGRGKFCIKIFLS